MFVLFFANRYMTLLGHVPFLVYTFWIPETQYNLSVSHFSHGLSSVLTYHFGTSGEQTRLSAFFDTP